MSHKHWNQRAKNLWGYPKLHFPYSFFGDESEAESWLEGCSDPSHLSISEEGDKICVEAAMPGIDPDQIELTFENGILCIKGERVTEEKDKNKHYYQKGETSFCYRVSVPGDIDPSQTPEAYSKNGLIQVLFKKGKKGKSARIPVKRK